MAAACAGLTIGLVAAVLARRVGARPARHDAAREAFLELRRERMREARVKLVATRNGSAA
jgi:uncharacterized membrane-anchored protein YhcB (DUF1043 family)